MSTATAPRRPVLRYYGGKWRLAPQITALFPAHSIYVEPFGGAASVLLNKPRSATEIYNDLDSEVVHFMRILRDRPAELRDAVALTPYSREEYERAYQRTTRPVERARRFVFRSAAGIGADSSHRQRGFRVSVNEQSHNTAKSWAGWPESIVNAAERMRGVVIEHKDASTIMRAFDSADTLHYVDPPYLASTRRSSSKGYAKELKTDESHQKLLDFLARLKGKVVLSGYASPVYSDILKGWHARALTGARDQQNARREEIIWCNFQPEPVLFHD